jgi:hypothetical protein
MTTKQNPTNSDIYKAVLRLEQKQGATDEKIDQIHKQAKLTNGRVTALEQKEQKRANWDEFIEKSANKSPSEVKEGWTAREKTLTAIITALLAIVTALVGTNTL